MTPPLTLFLFCRVIDNYGDMAVTWRLIKGLYQVQPSLNITLVTDDLRALSQLVPSFEEPLKVIDWTWFETHIPEEMDLPQVTIEAFACDLPSSFLQALHSAPLSPGHPLRCRLIINLEYLTAESWFLGVHTLPSLTGTTFVEKFTWVPGFLSGLGGLIFDRVYLQQVELARSDLPAAKENFWRALKSLLPDLGPCPIHRGWISVFSYEHDFSNLAQTLSGMEPCPLVLLPPGLMTPGLRSSFAKWGLQNHIQTLPFLPQTLYDQMITVCDLNLVRGEESLVRAALCGRPFLWHAYLQDEGYQIEKVQALLQVIEPFWTNADAKSAFEEAHIAYNTRIQNSSQELPREDFRFFSRFSAQVTQTLQEFAEFLKNNGDCPQRLLDFIQTFRV